MINKLISLFNFSKISQNNTIIYNTTIDTQIRQIKRVFNEGNISIAFKDIDAAKEEHLSNEKAKYQLLLLETNFYLTLKNFEKAKEIFSFIEKNFNSFLDLSFYETKATISSFDEDKQTFDEISKKIRIEFNKDNNSEEYFKIVYLLNAKEFKEALKVLSTYKEKENTKRVKYIEGLLYYNLFLTTNEDSFLQSSKVTFEKYIEEYEIDFFERLEVNKILTTCIFEQIFSHKKVIDYENRLREIIKILENIKSDYHFFGENARITMTNIFLSSLWILDEKEQYFNEYEAVDESKIDYINFYFFNIKSKEELDLKKIEKKIEKRIEKEELLVVPYVEKLAKIDPSKMMKYIKLNDKYLDYDVVLSLYVKAQIENNDLSPKTLAYLEKRKNDSLITYIGEVTKIQTLFC